MKFMKMYMVIKKARWLLLIGILFIIGLYSLLKFQNELLTFLYKDKIWAHRVNSIEKYDEAIKIYPGVEIDLVYNANNDFFDVNHPPVKSINLSLKAFLKSHLNIKKYSYWLDYKNLNEDNYFKSLETLNTVIKELNFNRNNIIVESTSPKLLKPFRENGYKTSYYLPSNLLKLESIDFQRRIKIITNNLQKVRVDYLSTDSNQYEIVKKHFPNYNILTWNLLNDKIKINSFYQLKRSFAKINRKISILRDDNIQVVLIKFESKKGNR